MPRTTRGPEGLKLGAIGFRTTREVREKLEKAARESGRSLSQEIEIRLAQSFESESLIDQIYGNPHSRAVMALVTAAHLSTEDRTGKLFFKWGAEEMVSAVANYLTIVGGSRDAEIRDPTGAVAGMRAFLQKKATSHQTAATLIKAFQNAD